MAQQPETLFTPTPAHPYQGLTMQVIVDSQMKVAILSALQRHQTIVDSADELGVSRHTLKYQMKRLGITGKVDPRHRRWVRRDVSVESGA